MSRRKIHSQGSIPFSWEDTPGVSRISRQECPLDKGLRVLNLESSSTSPSLQPSKQDPGDSTSFYSSVPDIKIPLPPCPLQRPLGKSTSSKSVIGWWQEDPFLAAYRECTKSARNTIKLSTSEMSKKTSVGSKLLRKKNKFLFSCKNSCEVPEDNFMRLSNLPPLPKARIRTNIE